MSVFNKVSLIDMERKSQSANKIEAKMYRFMVCWNANLLAPAELADA